MVLKDIMAISGEPGLFKFVAQGKNAIIVEHLETKKRSSAFGSAKVSSLEEISIYTEGEDIPLSKVFDLIYDKEGGKQAPDYKSDPEKLKAYLVEVLPAYDKDRVYVSDIKKIFHWYNILQSLNLLVREEPAKPEEKEEEKTAEPVTEKSPAKKPAAKKEKTGEPDVEKAPKKKASKPKEK